MSEPYWTRLAQKRVGRRRMVVGTVLAGSSFAVATSVGCRAGSSDTQRQPGRAESTPVAGGILRYSTGGSPATLNPFKEASTNTAWIVLPCYNGLLRPDVTDAGRTLLPDLATKWEQPDDTTYTFSLPANALFHDGTELGRAVKAEDVAASLSRVIAPTGQQKPTPRTGLITAVERIEAPNDTTVVFKLKSPSASLLRLLAIGWMVVVPKEALESDSQLDTRVIGSGPFMLQSFDSRTGAKLVKNPKYFRTSRPYLDGIEHSIITDTNTRVSAFAAGQQDIYALSMNESQRQVVKGSNIEWDVVEDSVSGPAYHICVRTAPYTDVRVRQATNAAINRQETYAVNLPSCPMLLQSPMGQSQWGLSQDELAKRQGNRIGADKAQDIKEAKALLAAAGLSNGFETEIIIGESVALGTSLGPDAVGLVVAQNLSAIGVKANVNKLDYTILQRRANALDYHQASYAISFPAPDPSGLGSIFASGAGRNYSGVTDAEIDRLLQQQERTLKPEERLKVVQDLQRRILDTYSGLYLTQEKPCQGNIPHYSHVHNWRTNWNAYVYDGIRMEDVWVEPRKS